MHIALKIALYSYAITTVLNIILFPIKDHKHLLKEHGKRKAYMDFVTDFFFCFIPYIVFIMIVIFETGELRKNINKWIEKDPTNPQNIANPDFVPSPKKEKKVKPVKPIKDRFEIMDL